MSAMRAYGYEPYQRLERSPKTISCFFCVIGFVTIYFIIMGQEFVKEGEYYGADSTEEICLITSANSESCDCGDACTAYKYSYTAVAAVKCGFNTTLGSIAYENNRFECEENAKPLNINETYDCHVPPCDTKTFSFESGPSLIKKGKEWTTAGIIAMCIAFVLMFIFCYCAAKEKPHQMPPHELKYQQKWEQYEFGKRSASILQNIQRKNNGYETIEMVQSQQKEQLTSNIVDSISSIVNNPNFQSLTNKTTYQRLCAVILSFSVKDIRKHQEMLDIIKTLDQHANFRQSLGMGIVEKWNTMIKNLALHFEQVLKNWFKTKCGFGEDICLHYVDIFKRNGFESIDAIKKIKEIDLNLAGIEIQHRHIILSNLTHLIFTLIKISN